ncbi:hypothetical protein AALP_AA2G116800 [Arabis alpina]|uniref:Uncharacterized protein n=1 Tax=Arabis alpina TaxID=50452 RepID=A0A087HGT3_ARAAL|nr:hypothetical protein AALP_AA2G116800 [Arabis alpina]
MVVMNLKIRSITRGEICKRKSEGDNQRKLSHIT